MFSKSQFNILLSILLVTIFCFGGKGFGQNNIVKIELDTHRITLGDQIYLKYSVDRGADQVIRFPGYADTLIEGIEVLGLAKVDSSKLEGESWSMTAEFVITSFDTGIYYIPPQPLLVESNGNSEYAFSEATYLEVIGVAIDTSLTVRDIKGAEKMPLSFQEILLYSIPVILLVLLGFGIYWYLKRKEKSTPLFKPVKQEEPAYISALRELDKIKVKKLWQQNKIKEYYTSITHVVRWYIEKRYNIPALEQTSDEILSDMKRQQVDNVNFANLEKLLNLADMVKFAKGKPDPEENVQHLENAYDFVKITKEVFEELKDIEEVNKD